MIVPQAIAAERAILSCFLQFPKEIGPLCARRKVNEESFSSPQHFVIFKRLLAAWSNDAPLDFITLTEALRHEGLLEDVGGAAGITELFTLIPTAANAENYVALLSEKRLLRQVIAVCQEFSERVSENGADATSLLAEIQGRVAGLGVVSGPDVPTMKENVVAVINALEGQVAGTDGSVAVGLKALDEDVGPLERGNLVVIGGQTKAGKSILAGQIALNVAMTGKPVLYLSLEMTEKELTSRMLASLARVNTRMVKLWSEGDYARFTARASNVSTLPMHIVCRRYELAELVATCQQYHARYQSQPEPLAVIVLDYAQLATAGGKRDDRRQQEIAEISRTCKRLAGSLNVLFILLTQLNDDGRSREARDIEHDANLMVEVGHDKETGARGVKVSLARSAPAGQLLQLRVIAEHTRVEDGEPFNPETDHEHQRQGHNGNGASSARHRSRWLKDD